jgi:iron-sulfur cluster repair protein YtfE (RIC family)
LITKSILIEDLVREFPCAVTYLMEHGIRCLRCGEPIWGTLESAAKEKGFSADRINAFVTDLNRIINS